MKYENYQKLAFERQGRILRVTIDNPPLNMMVGALHRDLHRFFEEINHDDETGVVILTGRGEAFCAGLDIAAYASSFDKPMDYTVIASVPHLLHAMIDVRKPIIARLNGDTIGVGATIALFCDIIVAADHATIADPHVRAGLVAGDGSALMWPLLIGLARAKEYLLTGNPINAKDAAAMGLINRAVPAAALDEEVDRLAAQILANAPMAVDLTKQALNMLLKQFAVSLATAHIGLETFTKASQDHKEAVLALRDNRAPSFIGR
jgi:enoyl-CoA hydratase